MRPLQGEGSNMKSKRESIVLPVDAFDACPSCGCKEGLLKNFIDVYCCECGWDSSATFVESGGMDQLIYEYEEQLALEEAKRIYRKPDVDNVENYEVKYA